jgi:hypothetical protein
MKTSFSVKVTGSITISIEPSNEDGGSGAATDDVDDGGNILVDVLLKSLVNDAIKKYAVDKGTTVEEEDRGDDDDDLSSPLPQRCIPSDADEEEDEEEQDSEADDEAAELPTVQVDNEYEEDYQLSQKMDMMSLLRRY